MISDLLPLLDRLIAFDTTPTQAVEPVLDWVAATAEAAGAVVRRVWHAPTRRGALLARLGPAEAGGVVLSGHVDVVSVEGQVWSSDPFRLRRDGTRLYGRGTCDMKGFNACGLALFQSLAAQPLDKPVYLAFSTDEETQNATIADVVALLADEPTPSAIIVGEPSGMDIVTAHKGTHTFFVDILGRAAHSSCPDLGISALEIAYDIMTEIRAMGLAFETTTQDDAFDPPYVTINLGQIAGGVAANIVAEHGHLTWQMRQILNEQAVETEQRFRTFLDRTILARYPGAEVALRTETFPPLEPRLSNAAADRAALARPEARLGTAPFATEAGFLQRAGYDVVVCGPGHIAEAHRPDEFVDEEQLISCLTFLKNLTTDLLFSRRRVA
jgi:acetylornithine deacetylase